MLPPRHEMCFYRTQDGTEADLVIVKAGIPDILIEIKYRAAPALTKSMHIAAADLQTRRNVIVAPVTENYPMRDGFEVLGYSSLRSCLTDRGLKANAINLRVKTTTKCVEYE